MNSKWPKVKLGDVLRLDLDRVPVHAGMSFPMVGVLSFGRGLFDREPIENGNTSYKYFYRLKANHIVMSQLFGWEGALALSSEEFAGKFMSPQFPTFLCDETKLHREFLGWIMRRPAFWEDLGSRASGMGDRRRTLNPEALFACDTPLPPMAEQRRIVAKIDQLAAKIAEARGLCDQTIAETEFLTRSVFNSAFQSRTDWKCAEVGDLCEPPQYGFTESAITDPIGPHFLRITDIQGGSVNWDSVPYCDCPDPTKYLLQPDDILFARTGATTGKSFLIAECPTAVFASYLIRLRVRKQVTPEYLYIFFQSPQYWNQIADQKKGTGQPNLNGSKLSHLRIPVPPLHEQSHIVSWLKILQAKVNVLRGLQAQTTAELDALLPSILDKAFKGEL